jgi:hypothetical protein
MSLRALTRAGLGVVAALAPLLVGEDARAGDRLWAK